MSFKAGRATGSLWTCRFDTAAADGGVVGFSATLEVADFDVYKGVSETQRTSTSGFAINDDFDSIVGAHVFSADLSDNTDAGFYSAGADLGCLLHPDETVSTETVVKWIGECEIETVSVYALREFYEKRFIGHTIATTTSNDTTHINATEYLDPQTPDGATIGEIRSVWDATDGNIVDVIVTGLTSLVEAVVHGKDGSSAMAITVAAGDKVWRNGHTAANMVRMGNVANAPWSATRGAAGTALPAAAADAAGGLPISDAGGLDIDAKLANTNEVTAARMGALTDWIDAGRLDLLLDAIKAKTDSLNFTVAGEVNANARYLAGTAVIGAGTSGNKWRA